MTDLLAEAQAAYSSQPQWDRIVREDIVGPGCAHFERPPSCTACRHGTCCDQSVFIWLYEALPIAYALRASGRDCPQLRSLLHVRDELQRGETTFQHWERHLGCALQDPGSKLCSVYAARPGICRAFVLWEDAEDCRKSLGKSWSSEGATRRYHQRIGPSLFLSSIRLQQRLGLPAKEALRATLPGGVLGVLQALDVEPSKQLGVLEGMPWVDDDTVDRLGSEEPIWRPCDLMACMRGCGTVR